MSKFSVLTTVSVLSLIINQAGAVKFDKKDFLSEDNNNLAAALYNNSKVLLEEANDNLQSDALTLDKESNIKLQKAQKEYDNGLEELKKRYPNRKSRYEITDLHRQSRNWSLMANTMNYSQNTRKLYAQYEKRVNDILSDEEKISREEKNIRNNFLQQERQIKEQYTLLPNLRINYIDFQNAKVTFQKLFNDISLKREDNNRIAKGKKPGHGVPTKEEILETIKKANSFLKKFDADATEILTRGFKSEKKEKNEDGDQLKKDLFIKIDNVEPSAERLTIKPLAKIGPKSIDARFFLSKDAVDFNDEIDQKIRTTLETLKVEDLPMEGTSPSPKSQVIRRSWNTYSNQYAQKKIVLFSGHTGNHGGTYDTNQKDEYYMIDQCWQEVSPDAVLDVLNERHMRYIPSEQVSEIVADDARFLSDETIHSLSRTLKPGGKIIFHPGFGTGWPSYDVTGGRTEIYISDNGRSASAPASLWKEIQGNSDRKEAFIQQALEKAIPYYQERGFKEIAFDREKRCFILTK